MRTLLKIVGYLLLFILLTVVSQVGGLVLLAALLLRAARPGWRLRYVFPLLYMGFWLLIPYLSRQLSGRVALPLWATAEQPLGPQNIWLVLANRHYVQPELRTATMEALAQFQSAYPDLRLSYLDASFPFWDGFPLLPHFGHNRGRKLDLSFIYQRPDGSLRGRAPAFFGYGRTVPVRPGEEDMPTYCAREGYRQYSIIVPIASPFVGQQHTLAEAPTAYWLRCLVGHPAIRRAYLEPHLQQRLGLQGHEKVRHHGCWAIRHDDHVHVQL